MDVVDAAVQDSWAAASRADDWDGVNHPLYEVFELLENICRIVDAFVMLDLDFELENDPTRLSETSEAKVKPLEV